MNTSWNLQELRELILSRGGNERLSHAQVHIHSVDWKIQLASFHSYQASQAFVGIFAGDGKDTVQAVRMLLSSGDEAQGFSSARLAYEAHILACAQTMHSVADVFAHLISDALGLGYSDDDHLSLSEVKKRLPTGLLRDQVIRFLGLKQFAYLQDFVNRTKHVSLVSSKYNAHLVAPQRHGLLFSAFSRSGRTHKEKWGEDFLLELKQLSLEYVQLGRALNAALREQESVSSTT